MSYLHVLTFPGKIQDTVDTSRVSHAKSWKERDQTPSVLDGMAVSRERVREQLLALRQLHGTPDKLLSQAEAARRAKVDVRNWSRWENKHVTPDSTSLGLLAEGFDIPLDVFDDGQEDRSSTPLADRLEEIDRKLDRLLTLSEPGEDAGLEDLDAELDRQESAPDEEDEDEPGTG